MEFSISLQKACCVTVKDSFDYVLLSGKFYIFNIDSRRLQKFYFTVYSIMNMITAFPNLLQLHGILLILDLNYLVVLVVAILKSNLKRIPKHTHAL